MREPIEHRCKLNGAKEGNCECFIMGADATVVSEVAENVFDLVPGSVISAVGGYGPAARGGWGDANPSASSPQARQQWFDHRQFVARSRVQANDHGALAPLDNGCELSVDNTFFIADFISDLSAMWIRNILMQLYVLTDRKSTRLNSSH